ncbi:histidinol-phosphate transaminase [Bogoriella caseilytica]|uniref:Aromatic amino acid aminotransferase n=1 Tax=Bogoriella caseilytica TaxID=56055 RepID=A0A3N2BBR6_9MICO|nr:histidinol-phosphate transaminase [Bogoriella caseilytica]ROR72711.1 histidinol-phosphate aminotransferase [Bogoriella caseilytica]
MSEALGHGVTPRPEIAGLPAYVPGQRPEPGRRIFKLSSNEVALPPLPAVMAAIADAAGDANRYPDMYATALTEALAAHVGVGADQIVAGNGSVAVLSHVLTAVCRPGDEVVIPWRSFEAYPIVLSVAGAQAVPVPLDAEGRHDLARMADAVTERTRAVMLCTPNNPTGPALTHREVRDFLAAVPPQVLVVLDEAYLEFVRNDDPVDGVALAAAHQNLVLLRTFSKAYGLAGLRVGYAVASPALAGAVRSASTPFGVNAAAQAAGLAALSAQQEVAARVASVVRERERMRSALLAMGWQVPDPQGNFLWFPLGDQSLACARAAQEAGVLVRPFSGDGVRISVGEPEANSLVLELAESWLT